MKIMISLSILMTMTLFACKSSKDTVTNTEKSVPVQTRNADQKGKRGAPPTADELLSQMDADKDGRLAKSETKGRMLEMFDKADTDGDGYLTKEELENAPKPARGQRKNR